MVDQVVADRVLDSMNSAFRADPNAMHALIVNRVPCNTALADHPDFIVDILPASPEDTCFTVGVLGVLNGILPIMGLPKLAAKFDGAQDAKGRRRFCGFQWCVPPEGVSHEA